MTTPTFRQDGYMDAVLGAGAIAALTSAIGQSDAAMYAEGGLPARVVDLPADNAVKGGITITGDTDGVILAEVERLKVLPLLADAARWARLRGGGCLLLIVADGGLLRDPMNVDRLDTIHELRVYDIDDLSVDRSYNNPNEITYGQPELYRLSVRGAGTQVLVHESRLVEVPGDPMPASMKQDSIPWRGRAAAARAFRRISPSSTTCFRPSSRPTRGSSRTCSTGQLVHSTAAGCPSRPRPSSKAGQRLRLSCWTVLGAFEPRRSALVMQGR